MSLSGSSYFHVPHSLALHNQYNVVCVADRENGRILCYRSDTGKFVTEFSHNFGGKVYAIAFNDDGNTNVMHCVWGSDNSQFVFRCCVICREWRRCYESERFHHQC